MNNLPYRRQYARLLMAGTVVATLVFPLLPKVNDGFLGLFRISLATFGVTFAMIWGPALAYAGWRTKCPADVFAGVIGMLTLLFWIPGMIFEW